MAFHPCELCGQNNSGQRHQYLDAVLMLPGGFKKIKRVRICWNCIKEHKIKRA